MFYEVHGQTGSDARTIILSSGLGGSGGYWAPQMAALNAHFRVVTYDHRGTGKTGGELPDGYTISDMADDVLEIAADLGIEHFDFMGHALGGLVGFDIALRKPGMIRRLIPVNAWSKADPHSGRCFDVRIALLEHAGLGPFLKAQPLFLYPAVWMSENTERLAAEEAHGAAHFQGKANILKRIAALRAFDIDARLGEIDTKTLLIATKDDLLVPYTRSERLGAGLTNASLALTDFGGHAVNVTAPGTFNGQILSFLLETD